MHTLKSTSQLFSELVFTLGLHGVALRFDSESVFLGGTSRVTLGPLHMPCWEGRAVGSAHSGSVRFDGLVEVASVRFLQCGCCFPFCNEKCRVRRFWETLAHPVTSASFAHWFWHLLMFFPALTLWMVV